MRLVRVLSPNFSLVVLLLTSRRVGTFEVSVTRHFARYNGLIIFATRAGRRRYTHIQITRRILRRNTNISIVITRL